MTGNGLGTSPIPMARFGAAKRMEVSGFNSPFRSMRASMPRWSPTGKQIAFSASIPEAPWNNTSSRAQAVSRSTYYQAIKVSWTWIGPWMETRWFSGCFYPGRADWLGLAPDKSPLFGLDISTQEILRSTWTGLRASPNFKPVGMGARLIFVSSGFYLCVIRSMNRRTNRSASEATQTRAFDFRGTTPSIS
jgi:hypothetical protein